jgi:hypothetical protein
MNNYYNSQTGVDPENINGNKTEFVAWFVVPGFLRAKIPGGQPFSKSLFPHSTVAARILQRILNKDENAVL